MAKQMKTWNGYEIVDDVARKDIASLGMKANQIDLENLESKVAEQVSSINAANTNVQALAERVKILEDAEKTELETVDSVNEMTDTSKQYVLSSTNTVWAYGETEVDDTDRNLFDASKVTLNANLDGSTRNGAMLTDYIPVDIDYSDPYVVTISGTGAKVYGSGNPCIYKVSYYKEDKTYISGMTGERYSQQAKYSTISSNVVQIYPGYYDPSTKYNGFSETSYVRFLFTLSTSAITTDDIPTDLVITTPEPKTRIDAGWYNTGVSAEDAKTGLVEISLQVDKNTDNIVNNTQRIGVLEDALSELDVALLPDYWQTAIDDLEEVIKIRQSVGADALQFVLISDIHGTSGYVNSNGAGTSATIYIGQIARYIMDKFNIPFVVITGDIMSQSSHTSEEKVWNEYEAIAEILKPIKEDELLAMKGNHDGSWYTTNGVSYLKNIGNKQTYNAIYRKQRKDRTRVFGNDGTYFYVEDDKARYVVLNSHTDGDGSIDENGYAIYNAQKNNVYGQEQLEWLINVALNNTNGKSIIVFGHPQIAQSADGILLSGILNAYNNRDTYSNSVTISADYWGTDVADTTYKIISVNADFSDATGEVIAYFHGHNHKDNMNTTSFTFPSIGITTAGGDVRDANPVKRVVGTATETALDIVTIDMKNRNIYMTRVGAGADRETSY